MRYPAIILILLSLILVIGGSDHTIRPIGGTAADSESPPPPEEVRETGEAEPADRAGPGDTTDTASPDRTSNTRDTASADRMDDTTMEKSTSGDSRDGRTWSDMGASDLSTSAESPTGDSGGQSR